MAKCYTITFSIIFGLFLSIIPNVLNESCRLALDLPSIIAILIAIIGCVFSYFFGNAEKYVSKIKARRNA
jgi:putative membrane protein